jgi:bifunctional UDP-N-acetylglucosamine pyrophosphorylase/glucosamine-1-phosphate N-acetyltransferase
LDFGGPKKIKKTIKKLEGGGVLFVSTDGVVISPSAKIAAGVVIYPGTIIKGGSEIGENTVLGPNSLIDDSIIGKNCVINTTQIYSSTVGDNVTTGPFCHIRPGCVIKNGARLGNFVEVKNSVIGENTKAAHLTYIGDSDVGRNVNFGCGSVTVNYDGVKKARCAIADGAFIGCNVNLLAPVSLGENAYAAAGSTLSKNVPGGALAVSREREQKIIEGWAARHRKK